MGDRVTVTMRGGVADVKMTRPEKMNAIDRGMFEALYATGKSLAQDKSVRAVVLSGEGRAFCAGLDFGSFMQMGAGNRNTEALVEKSDSGLGNAAQQAAFIWQELPMPVVAAIHGVAFGGGLQIALGADIRLVTPDAQLSVMEIKWGLIPDMSGTQTLRYLVRLDVAKELTFTGRIVSGTEAVQLGLATRVSQQPYEDAMAMAQQIAAKSPDAIRAGKSLINRAVQGTIAEGMKLEESLQLGLIGSENQIEAVRANMEKRTPEFRDPK